MTPIVASWMAMWKDINCHYEKGIVPQSWASKINMGAQEHLSNPK